jgi:hypothetical protein
MRMKCCICGNDITPDAQGWAGGHNADPVKPGRCCDMCNTTVVLPRRMADIARMEAQKKSAPA